MNTIQHDSAAPRSNSTYLTTDLHTDRLGAVFDNANRYEYRVSPFVCLLLAPVRGWGRCCGSPLLICSYHIWPHHIWPQLEKGNRAITFASSWIAQLMFALCVETENSWLSESLSKCSWSSIDKVPVNLAESNYKLEVNEQVWPLLYSDGCYRSYQGSSHWLAHPGLTECLANWCSGWIS